MYVERPTQCVMAPSHEELEAAWFELMQGELGVGQSPALADVFTGLFVLVRREADRGVPLFEAGAGEPLGVVSSQEMARRMAGAYACLFYGAP